LIGVALRRPWLTLCLAGVLTLTMLWPLARLGTEFMPQMDEGDLLYMPTTLPGISVGKARELLQQTDRLIRTLPEVDRVFGKVGRAETATDPAPLTMIETLVHLKPRDQWRTGMTMEKIRDELDARVRVPSLNNAWLMPIRTRIGMQSTGINTPVGIKILGRDLAGIQKLGEQVEAVLRTVPGTRSVLSDRAAGARYIDVDIDRHAAGHYGLSIAEIEEAANLAIAGQDITYTVEGRERYPVNLRYPQDWRDSVTKLKELPLVVTEDTQVQLQDLAEVRIADGPPLVKSENGRLNGWVYVTTDGRDIGSYVAAARQALQQRLKLPAGYTLQWVGQYQYLQRAAERLAYIVPLTLFIIFVLLYLSFRTVGEALMVMLAVPLALVGGVWLLWAMRFNLSVAVAVGFIAVAGVAAEFGVVMLVYLREAVDRRRPANHDELRRAVIEGAVLRVRPKAMTAAVIIAGLMPIMLGSGTGSEIMERIAAPMVGGMVTAPVMSMILLPVMYYLWHRRKVKETSGRQDTN
jgi:Cu(I)/Ag(I) efflux system membrane protein CusA/SilA